MSIPRLNQRLLATLPGIAVPGYQRDTLKPGILHIGVGAFHRAHQAVYTDDVLSQSGGNWGIVGASLRSVTAQAQLEPQDGLYTVNALTPTSTERRIVGAITRVITASTSDGFDELVRVMADPAIHVVTMTVTEKGYCHVAGSLDLEHEDVRHDLASDERRRSLPGLLAAGLEARRVACGKPITLVSCDNLASNGQVLRSVLLEYAQAAQPDLANWIGDNVSFPSTMVDRIVPATSDEHRAKLADDLGFTDEAMVRCEPFKQWVIEDQFAAPRPPWEDAGALLVNDITPYEQAKLRLLNGPHSACAYLGILRGYQHVHEVMQDDALREFISRLVDEEILPTVTPLPNLDLNEYVNTVFERFANSAVRYATRQVGTDGSQKLPQRLVPVARERLLAGQGIERLAMVFAAWVEHLRDPAPDPLAETLQSLYHAHDKPADLVNAIREQTPVFTELKEVGAEFTVAVSDALTQMRHRS